MLGAGSHTLPDWDADTFKAQLIDTGVGAVNLTDQDEADLPAEVAEATLSTITVGSVATGTVDAADTVFTSVSGNQSEEIVIYQDTGTPATSPLVVRFDTATGLPVTPNGGNITVVWSGSGIIQV